MIQATRTTLRAGRMELLVYLAGSADEPEDQRVRPITIRQRPRSRPGRWPATKSALIETPPATIAYTVITLLGGIRSPVVAEVTVRAVAKLLGHGRDHERAAPGA
jgi:hypothetical protein